MKLLLVVNLHGAINSSSGVRKAMTEMKVVRKFSASVVTDDVTTTGMLRLCKGYLAWAPADSELIALLLKKRGMVSESRTLDSASVKALGYKDHEEMAEKMFKAGVRLSAVTGIRPFFRLAPPRGGFKMSTRRQFRERGTLGANPTLPEIVRRMV